MVYTTQYVTDHKLSCGRFRIEVMSFVAYFTRTYSTNTTTPVVILNNGQRNLPPERMQSGGLRRANVFRMQALTPLQRSLMIGCMVCVTS